MGTKKLKQHFFFFQFEVFWPFGEIGPPPRREAGGGVVIINWSTIENIYIWESTIVFILTICVLLDQDLATQPCFFHTTTPQQCTYNEH